MPKKVAEKNNMEIKKKHIHVILDPDHFNKFKKIKSVLKQNSDVDVIRECIDKVFISINKDEISLRPILNNQIKLLLENDYLRTRHLVENANDVINDAVHKWIQSKRAEINLHNSLFRKGLQELEQKVALIFIEKQLIYERGLKLEDILKNLDGQNEKEIVQLVLKKFEENQLIQKNKVDNINYYFATLP